MAVQMRALLLADAALVSEGCLERLRRGDDRVSVVDVFERDETVLHVLLVFSLLLRTTTQRSCPAQLMSAKFRACKRVSRVCFFLLLFLSKKEGPDRWGFVSHRVSADVDEVLPPARAVLVRKEHLPLRQLKAQQLPEF